MIKVIFETTLVRFVTVGALVEALYLGIYSILLILSFTVTQSIFIAGAVCITLNGFLQLRWSFRVKFKTGLLMNFYAIQGLCLATNLVIGGILSKMEVNELIIGMITIIAWGGLSFMLSRAAFTNSRNQDSLSKKI